jgi:hypothetical protein
MYYIYTWKNLTIQFSHDTVLQYCHMSDVKGVKTKVVHDCFP